MKYTQEQLEDKYQEYLDAEALSHKLWLEYHEMEDYNQELEND